MAVGYSSSDRFKKDGPHGTEGQVLGGPEGSFMDYARRDGNTQHTIEVLIDVNPKNTIHII